MTKWKICEYFKYKWISKTYYWCFSYLPLYENYSKISGLNNKHLLSNSFHGSGIQEGPAPGVLGQGPNWSRSHLKAWLGTEDWLPRRPHPHDCWQEASISGYMGLSIGLLECPHNKAADFPLRKWSKMKSAQDRSHCVVFLPQSPHIITSALFCSLEASLTPAYTQGSLHLWKGGVSKVLIYFKNPTVGKCLILK